MENKTQLYVLTGFLGSGKTTILLKLLDSLKGKKVGIIQNEFGKLGIDGTILRNDDIQMVEINRGSIFCSCLKLSFVQALQIWQNTNLITCLSKVPVWAIHPMWKKSSLLPLLCAVTNTTLKAQSVWWTLSTSLTSLMTWKLFTVSSNTATLLCSPR